MRAISVCFCSVLLFVGCGNRRVSQDDAGFELGDGGHRERAPMEHFEAGPDVVTSSEPTPAGMMPSVVAGGSASVAGDFYTELNEEGGTVDASGLHDVPKPTDGGSVGPDSSRLDAMTLGNVNDASAPRPPATLPADADGGQLAPPMPPTCENTMPQGFEGSESNTVPGATWLFTESDVNSTFCMTPTRHCLEVTSEQARFHGIAADPTTDYSCWGALFGATMAVHSDTGLVVEAWDAAAYGVTAMRFHLQGTFGGPKVRLALSEVGLPPDVEYLYGSGLSDLASDGTYVLALADFGLASWTVAAHPEFEGRALDPTDLKGLALRVVATPGAALPFDITVRVEWLNEELMPVEVPDRSAN